MPLSLRRRYLLGSLLGLGGLWLNEANVPLLTQETPGFGFGGAAVLVAFVSLGTGPGILSALVSLAAVIVRGDGESLAALIGVLEPWAACLLYRRFGSLVFAVAIFWFTLGWAVDVAVHGALLGLPLESLTLLLIRQVLNGILNALIAEAMLRLPAVGWWLPARDSILPASLQQHVFNRVVFTVMIPALALALLYAHTAYQGRIEQARARLEQAARDARARIQELLLSRESALRGLARELEADWARGVPPSSDSLETSLRAHPDFSRAAVADPTGALVALGSGSKGGAPPSPDLIADPSLVRQAGERLQVVYAPLATEPSLLRPAPGPTLALAAPILGGDGPLRGVLLVTLEDPPIPLDALRPDDSGALATLVDQDLRIIASLDPRRAVGSSLRGFVPAAAREGTEPATFTLVARPGSDARPERRHAAYQRLDASGWAVLVELPTGTLDREMMPAAYRMLLVIVLTLCLLYAALARLARKVSDPLLAINAAAHDIAEGRVPGSGSLQALAANPIEEIQSVAFHFLSMRDALAYRDSLTGLPNRQLFLDRLSLAVAQARRNREELAVLVLDLDRFRLVEDSLGRAAGNDLLRGVAYRLRHCVREGDTIARLGADEFAVLIREVAQAEDALRVARKLLDSLREPFLLGERELVLTATVGISLYPPDGEAPEVLLKNADTAMYRAKGEGRDTYRLYTPAMNDQALERLALEAALRKALVHHELAVHYQPVVDVRSGQVHGAEALLRWRHPDLGLLDPGRFLSLAEVSGLIVAIDSWVLRTACARAREWRERGRAHVRVGVNLSARQFQQADLVGDVTRCLYEAGLPPEALEIEITEGTALQDVARSAETLRGLRALGIRVSLDDFGTGYSSLSHLRNLPVDTVKLDQSFVRNVTSDAGDAAIARAIIAIAHTLDLAVVAEGVETWEQFQFLREQGCDAMQGHLFSAAVPADAIDELLCRRTWLLPEAT